MMQRNNTFKTSDKNVRRKYTTGLIEDHKTTDMRVKPVRNILELEIFSLNKY